jgi:chondroitin AC lyase
MAGRDDVEAVARRLRQRVLERQSGGDVEELFTSMTADGRWPDIDYDGRDLADWAPREHLDRTRRLCRAYPTHALRAVDAWLRLDPQSGNWWHNQLGSPIAFGDALVLLTSYLSDEQRTLGGARLARAVWDKMTAQNLIWAAQAQLRRGVVLDDAAILAAAFDRVKATIFISQDEGIQPDFSFHQHGPLLYFAGYGHDFAVDTAELAFLARDTVFAFAQPLLDILAGYLLDGSQWAVHGHSTYDFTAAGRVIARPSTQDDARLLADAARQLAVAGAGRSAELRAFAARIEGDGAALHGNRHFWCSDYQAHHRAGWSSSVKMTSTRMAPTETGNGEALRSWYLGEGINPVWVSDEDYRDLFPVWDWRQLPGLTAEQADGALPLLDWQGAPDGTLVRGGRDFVGGVSDGRHGMAVMRLAKDAIVDGRKAWFHFDDEIVALGAGIAAPAASAPVYTTLNQTAAAGQWRYAAAFGDVVAGSGTVRDPRWAHHGRIGYVFPTATGPVRLTRESRTGSWRDISHPESADPVRRDVATVAIDHGAAPRSAGYAYIIVPDVDCTQTAEYSESSPISIIANTEAVQAVRHDLLGVTQLAFYQPGRLEVTTALTVSVDAPVLLQITEESDGMSLAAANPRNEPLTVAVGCGAPVRIELPAGEAAGRTVVKKLSRELA